MMRRNKLRSWNAEYLEGSLDGRLKENLSGREERRLKAKLSLKWPETLPCEELGRLVPGRATASTKALRWDK